MNANEILMYLERVSNEHIVINFLNHIVIIMSILLCFTKIRQKQKIIVGSIILINISLVGNALYYGSMFHLITFSIMLVFLICICIKNVLIM